MNDNSHISTEELRTRVDSLFPELLEALTQWVAIPSVSSLPEHDADLECSAQWVRDQFAAAGLEARIESVTTPQGIVGKPAILAHTPRIEGAPTVLLYAHHDVQPTGDVSCWTSHPYEAQVRGDRLYGRGTSDDGAGIMVHLGALRALREDIALNVVVFIEGEEEIGSPSFETFLETYREELQADVIVVADSDNWKVGEPALTTTLRGNTRCVVTVSVADHAVHSGMFGGPLVDAVTCASMLISSFYDDKGNIAIEGLKPVDPAADRADVEWEEAEYRDAAGVLEGVQLAGSGDLAARTWTKPSISVIGWDQTSIADASNSIQPTTRFFLSVRTAPGQDPQEALDALTAHLTTYAPFGARVEISDIELGDGYQADTEAPATHIAHAAMEEAWGVPAVNIGVGGSIPFISEFQKTFPEAQVLVTGVEDPHTNAHSEDESQSISDLKTAVLSEAIMLREFAGMK